MLLKLLAASRDDENERSVILDYQCECFVPVVSVAARVVVVAVVVVLVFGNGRSGAVVAWRHFAVQRHLP